MRESWIRALTSCGCEVEAAATTALELFWSSRVGVVRLFDEVATTLQQLNGRLPMGVITNGPADTQLDKLQVTGFGSYFDPFVASSEVGVLKPDQAIFRFALDKLGLSPEQVWHIGDNLEADVAGAKAAGLTAVWLNRNGTERKPEDPTPDLEIETLSQLGDLLNLTRDVERVG
jgi:putative hydrolase of the HAD superfamily